MISIKAQSPALQVVLKAAICEITGNALFITAYPSVVTINKYLCNTLKTATKNLNLSTIYDRFEDDHKFVETMLCVVCHPMLMCLLCLILDCSWLSAFQTSVVALKKWLQQR